MLLKKIYKTTPIFDNDLTSITNSIRPETNKKYRYGNLNTDNILFASKLATILITMTSWCGPQYVLPLLQTLISYSSQQLRMEPRKSTPQHKTRAVSSRAAAVSVSAATVHFNLFQLQMLLYSSSCFSCSFCTISSAVSNTLLLNHHQPKPVPKYTH